MKFKHLKKSTATKLEEVSKKITEVDKMNDEQIIKFGTAMTNSLKDFKTEAKTIQQTFTRLITILEAERDKRGIKRLHENQLSLFDNTTAITNKLTAEVKETEATPKPKKEKPTPKVKVQEPEEVIEETTEETTADTEFKDITEDKEEVTKEEKFKLPMDTI